MDEKIQNENEKNLKDFQTKMFQIESPKACDSDCTRKWNKHNTVPNHTLTDRFKKSNQTLNHKRQIWTLFRFQSWRTKEKKKFAEKQGYILASEIAFGQK